LEALPAILRIVWAGRTKKPPISDRRARRKAPGGVAGPFGGRLGLPVPGRDELDVDDFGGPAKKPKKDRKKPGFFGAVCFGRGGGGGGAVRDAFGPALAPEGPDEPVVPDDPDAPAVSGPAEPDVL